FLSLLEKPQNVHLPAAGVAREHATQRPISAGGAPAGAPGAAGRGAAGRGAPPSETRPSPGAPVPDPDAAPHRPPRPPGPGATAPCAPRFMRSGVPAKNARACSSLILNALTRFETFASSSAPVR